MKLTPALLFRLYSVHLVGNVKEKRKKIIRSSLSTFDSSIFEIAPMIGSMFDALPNSNLNFDALTVVARIGKRKWVNFYN